MNQRLLTRILTLCVIFLCLFGCGNRKKGRKKPGTGNSPQTTTESKSVTLVLCHGLGSNPAVLEPMKKKLGQDFPKAQIIVPHEQDTFQKSIEEQSKALVDALKQQNVSKETPLVFIGHSQGGLRAGWAAYGLANDGYQVEGVVPIGSPLEGVPALDNKQEIDYLLKNIKTSFSKLPIAQQLSAGLEILNNNGPGVLDMKPQSPFLTLLHDKMKSVDIPVLAIGGDASSFFSIIDAVMPMKFPMPGGKQLKSSELLSYCLGDASHDMLILLSSQLAQNVQAKNIERETVENATHFYIPGMPREALEVENLKVMKVMTAFIKKQLGATTPAQ